MNMNNIRTATLTVFEALFAELVSFDVLFTTPRMSSQGYQTTGYRVYTHEGDYFLLVREGVFVNGDVIDQAVKCVPWEEYEAEMKSEENRATRYGILAGVPTKVARSVVHMDEAQAVAALKSLRGHQKRFGDSYKRELAKRDVRARKAAIREVVGEELAAVLRIAEMGQTTTQAVARFLNGER